MQDIVIYAAANETLGIVRDYANARNQAAPVLVLGVSVCLRIRLFTACEGATPYPVSAFSGIVDWQWNMDADFDRSTTCKLAADAEAISVHTVTDTVNGETMDFTEFVIPISNMNTQELAAWLGNEKKRTGLNGELVGYDSEGNAAFVLQIENFTVRNRVAGLGDPTALDQGIVTRPVAESMIQSAVSSSASTKQDKLTAANAGTGISIDSAGTISTAAVPQSAVAGLSDSFAAKQDNLTAGYRMAIVSGSTVDQSRWFPVESPTGSTVTLMAGLAYRVNATASSKTLNAETGPENSFGLEGHLELFVAGTGFVKTGANVVLADALEPDSVNNCTVRFHDGVAIVSVEDHIAGYIVVSTTGSTAGTLPYALSTASQEYIAFDAALNGQIFDLGGASTYAGAKHVVGNGFNDTILTGSISCTSKTTFSNLGMDDVSVVGGTATLGDVNILSGATVSINGGLLVIEKVSGNGGVIDLGRTNIPVTSGTSAVASGVKIIGGSTERNGGCFYVPGGSITLRECIISGNTASSYGGAIQLNGGTGTIISCVISGNTTSYAAGGLNVANGATAFLSGCSIYGNTGPSRSPNIEVNAAYMELQGGNDIGKVKLFNSARISLAGSNSVERIDAYSESNCGMLEIESGAILDLTGNTNATPVNPGGGIVMPARPESAPVQIYYTDPDAPLQDGYAMREFNELEIRGTTITNRGIVLGATVTVPADTLGTWLIGTTEGTVELTSASAGDYVVSGGLTGVEKS